VEGKKKRYERGRRECCKAPLPPPQRYRQEDDRIQLESNAERQPGSTPKTAAHAERGDHQGEHQPIHVAATHALLCGYKQCRCKHEKNLLVPVHSQRARVPPQRQGNQNQIAAEKAECRTSKR